MGTCYELGGAIDGMVSVLIPAFNAESTLISTVESVINQTVEAAEIILVDDGSTDETKSIGRALEGRHRHVKLISTPNRGVSAARNTALDLAEGEFVLFLDADDQLHPSALERLTAAAQRGSEHGKAAVLIDYSIRGGESSILNTEKPWSSAELVSSLLVFSAPTSVWAYLFRRSQLLHTRFDEDIAIFEDVDFLVRALACFETIVCLPGQWHSYSPSVQGLSSRPFGPEWLTAITAAQNVVKVSNFVGGPQAKSAAVFSWRVAVTLIVLAARPGSDRHPVGLAVLKEYVRTIKPVSEARWYEIAMVTAVSVNPQLAIRALSLIRRLVLWIRHLLPRPVRS